jgi:hypothetical protein
MTKEREREKVRPGVRERETIQIIPAAVMKQPKMGDERVAAHRRSPKNIKNRNKQGCFKIGENRISIPNSA